MPTSKKSIFLAAFLSVALIATACKSSETDTSVLSEDTASSEVVSSSEDITSSEVVTSNDDTASSELVTSSEDMTSSEAVSSIETSEMEESSTEPATSDTSDETSEEPTPIELPEKMEIFHLKNGENLISAAADVGFSLQFTIPDVVIGSKIALSWTSENVCVVINGTPIDGTSTVVQVAPLLSIILFTIDAAAEEITLTVDVL